MDMALAYEYQQSPREQWKSKTKNQDIQSRYGRNGPGMSDLALKHLSNNYKTARLNNALVNNNKG